MPATDYIINSAKKVSEFCAKYSALIPEETYSRIEDVLLGTSKSVTIPASLIQKMDKDLENKRLFDELLSKTTERNNLGIAAEKNGRVEDAIRYYEENIKDGYPASHSFDRLSILYRKNKDLQNELRVLNLAIEVFKNDTDATAKWVSRKEKLMSRTEGHSSNSSSAGK